ncbi:DUF1264 domain-containing protein, partial [Corynebacterium diphtheriae]
MGAMSTYLNGLHFYADDLGRQVEASHFCIHLRHDLHQCVIFDRNAPDARLIGIEYIISEERFRSLPDEERRLWHSHHYEVSSGALTAPGVPELAEHSYFEDLIHTYGKTSTPGSTTGTLPVRHPPADDGPHRRGQVDEALLRARDERVGVDTAAQRRHRADIPVPDVVPGANSWEVPHGRDEHLPQRTALLRRRPRPAGRSQPLLHP